MKLTSPSKGSMIGPIRKSPQVQHVYKDNANLGQARGQASFQAGGNGAGWMESRPNHPGPRFRPLTKPGQIKPNPHPDFSPV